jgi:dTDP-4-amino-4,6-dideoxygalactose transaminase
VVRVGRGERDALMRYLKSQGVGTEIYYPVPLHLQACLSHLGYHEGDFPASEEACRCVLALPIFPGITAEQQARVIGSCANYLRVRSRRLA